MWVDLQPLGFSGAGGDNYASRWKDQAWHEAVRGNISLVMNHRAVLGYCESRFLQVPAASAIALRDYVFLHLQYCVLLF